MEHNEDLARLEQFVEKLLDSHNQLKNENSEINEQLRAKLKAGTLKEELMLGLAMWRKGKLHLTSRRSKAIGEIRAIYRRQRGEIE